MIGRARSLQRTARRSRFALTLATGGFAASVVVALAAQQAALSDGVPDMSHAVLAHCEAELAESAMKPAPQSASLTAALPAPSPSASPQVALAAQQATLSPAVPETSQAVLAHFDAALAEL